MLSVRTLHPVSAECSLSALCVLNALGLLSGLCSSSSTCAPFSTLSPSPLRCVSSFADGLGFGTHGLTDLTIAGATLVRRRVIGPACENPLEWILAICERRPFGSRQTGIWQRLRALTSYKQHFLVSWRAISSAGFLTLLRSVLRLRAIRYL